MKFTKLNAKIYENEMSKKDIATKLNITTTSLANKMNGKTAWTNEEMQTLCKTLKIEPKEIPSFFWHDGCILATKTCNL